jgi:hypothetical protein
MYLIEHFSRLQQDGREDTVSVFLASIDEDQLSPEMKEQVATFMRMAATFAKMAVQHDKPAYLELGCRMLNRAMADCSKDETH